MTNSRDEKSNYTPWTARNKMMDMLARREHSEKEIRTKLKEKDFSDEDIDQAIEFGRSKNWLPNNDESLQKLSEKTADAFHRKNKGILYINNYLSEKGLPPVQTDSSLELEKALAVVKNKKLDLEDLDDKEAEKTKAKLGRLLVSRGFDMDVVRKVIYEEL